MTVGIDDGCMYGVSIFYHAVSICDHEIGGDYRLHDLVVAGDMGFGVD